VTITRLFAAVQRDCGFFLKLSGLKSVMSLDCATLPFNDDQRLCIAAGDAVGTRCVVALAPNIAVFTPRALRS